MTWPQIDRDYVRTGKVKYVSMDYPLAFHKYAFKAHEAANCADEQGKYWEMHDRIYAKKGSTAPNYNELLGHAAAIRLDFSTFKRCLDSGKHAAEIRKDLVAGEEAGVKGTPTFMLGFTVPNDPEIEVLKILRGALPYSSFKKAIDELLSITQKK